MKIWTACRAGLTSTVLLLGCASAAPPAPLPTVPRPSVEDRADTLPPAPPSRLALPLALELGWLLPLVSQAAQRDLQLAQNDWTRVTPAGANPEVDTRMQASIGELQVAVKKDVVRVEVPVAYWGTVRARASTPFGSVWLSKGTEWGTREAPGQVTLTVELRPRVDRAFKLTTKTTLADVRFEAPRGDKLCTTTLVRICISRETAAAQVHDELDRAIRKAAPAWLKTVDAYIAERGDLRSFVAQALTSLATPSEPEQLALRVEALGLGPFGGQGTQLRVTTELAFTVTTGDASNANSAPVSVPPKSELRGEPSVLHYDFVLPLAALSERWSTQLENAKVGDWSVASFEVLGFEPGGTGLVAALSLARDAQRLTVFATSVTETRGAELRLASVRFSPESSTALASVSLAAERLATIVRERAAFPLTEPASLQLSLIARKLTALTQGLSPVRLTLTEPRFEALGAARQGLWFRALTSAGLAPATP